ncbi:hypothetical protein AMTR_s00068p00194800 [Amborella trichopoda]|uniref:Plasma membrane-associated cation-binding protein 1 n=2 Tax=Amborella trichopoda TaxID=13333 RepID=U5DDC7_AMBTC|nr:hypothetical protein AMTR_s00068p00194800 [Amborella trichopoda]
MFCAVYTAAVGNMSYWKDKVLPKIKKYFDKPAKKKAAAEACKLFDESKETINKEFEEKKTELQPKVVEIYEASSTEIKTVVKEKKESGIKKNSPAVQKFLEELVKIEFPGSKEVSEASIKFGAPYLSGPIIFIFEKVSTFIVEEKVDREVTVEEVKPVAETSEEPEKAVITEEKSSTEVVEKAETVEETAPPTETKEAKEAEKPEGKANP